MAGFLSRIDVDLPIACDDEYWINPDPKLAFKQPEGQPSTVTFFNCILRLTQIQAFALRTVVRVLTVHYCDVRSRSPDDIDGTVLDQPVEGTPRSCRSQMGAAYRRRAGLGNEQVDRFCT